VCESYRGICLIDVAAKIFATIILRQITRTRESKVRLYEADFRPEEGCVDQIFTLRRILEHRFKFQQPTTACFVDFKAAFDSVQRSSLWSILEADGVPDKLLALIKAYYSSTKARIRVYGEETIAFGLDSGVRQGCPLSPMLFNFVIDWVMEHSLRGYRGVQLSPATWITDLDYADDVVILGSNLTDLQLVLDRITQYGSQVGLEINAGKTKFFTTNSSASELSLSVNGEEIARVDSFKS
jgi:hypothetical protein